MVQLKTQAVGRKHTSKSVRETSPPPQFSVPETKRVPPAEVSKLKTFGSKHTSKSVRETSPEPEIVIPEPRGIANTVVREKHTEIFF